MFTEPARRERRWHVGSISAAVTQKTRRGVSDQEISQVSTFEENVIHANLGVVLRCAALLRSHLSSVCSSAALPVTTQ